MYCIKCGAEVTGTYCPKCGTSVRMERKPDQKNVKIERLKWICQSIIENVYFLAVMIISGTLCMISPYFRVVPISLDNDYCNMFTSWFTEAVPGTTGMAAWIMVLTLIALLLLSVRNNYVKILGFIFCIV